MENPAEYCPTGQTSVVDNDEFDIEKIGKDEGLVNEDEFTLNGIVPFIVESNDGENDRNNI